MCDHKTNKNQRKKILSLSYAHYHSSHANRLELYSSTYSTIDSIISLQSLLFCIHSLIVLLCLLLQVLIVD